MKNKKGFTLIELLAVIIILAILMIIAVPNILNTLATARKNAFRTQVQSIYKAAEQQFTINSMNNTYVTCFSDSGSNKLDLGSLSNDVNYIVKVSSVSGQITQIEVIDKGQGFKIALGDGSSAITQSGISTATIAEGQQSGSVSTCPAANNNNNNNNNEPEENTEP